MPRIIRTKTLATLRSQATEAETSAALARQAEREATGARHLAEIAQGQAAAALEAAGNARRQCMQAEEELQRIYRDKLNRAVEVLDLTRDPARGEEIRGALALQLMRQSIQDVKKHGTEEERDAIRVYEALLGPEDAGPAEQPAQAAAADGERGTQALEAE